MSFQIVRIPGTVEPILGAITTVSQFKDLIGSALGVMVVLSFLFGVVAFTVGVITRDRNPEMSKWSFVTAFLLALAVPAVTLMFSAAGLGSATVEPRF
jgi:hypothetical protein